MSAVAHLPRWWILAAGALVVIAQLAVPGSMLAARIALLSSPTEITLKTVPVDPRDLFRGDYVILSYDISEARLANVPHPETIAREDRVFAVIARDGEDWRVVSLHDVRPETIAGEHHVLSARVASLRGPSASRTAQLRYGIESYFVPEGTGKALEDMVRERALSVILAVGDSGDLAIKGLVIDGERIYEEPLF